MKIDDQGMIEEGPFDGLYLVPLAQAFRDSSWDFPSFVMALELDEVFEDDEITMYPDEYDVIKLADHLKITDPDIRENFLKNFPTTWDT